ncbi:kinase-like domain-containing protein [Tanacetum coccineum]
MEWYFMWKAAQTSDFLILQSQGLEGSLSPHVGNLSFLRDLSLRNNSFQATIPHELCRLSRLRCLHLHENKFSGVIPANLSGCFNLKELVLGASGNPLGGSIPDTILWKSLTVSYCYDYNLYGSIPRSIFNLSLLVNFSVAVNHLTGSLPSEIGNQLPNLEWLHLWDNELTGVLPVGKT